MAKKVIRYKDNAQWLAARSEGIGASEVGTVLGLNPFDTPYQLWRRKKGLDPGKAETFAMRAGHYLEDAVARFYADESKCDIIKRTSVDFTIIDTERPWLRVSPDRLFWRYGARHNEREKSVLECKTTQRHIDADDIPMQWFCQLQMNMGVGEYEDGALAWLTQGREFGHLDVKLDRDFFTWMSDKVTDYWTRYIVGNEVPEATTSEDVSLRYPLHSEGKSITASDDILGLLGKLRETEEKEAEYSTEIDNIKFQVKNYMGDCEKLLDATGNVLATWKANKPSLRFDAKQFKADNPEVYAKYLSESVGARQLRFKEVRE